MSNIIEHDAPAALPVYHGDAMSTAAMVLDRDTVNSMMRVAEIMASGKATVPQHLRNSAGDCLAVVMQAMQWRMNPFAVAQKTHLVNGTLGYEAQLVNAVIQASGSIVGRFHYEYQGEGAALSCRVGAVLRGETEITWGEWLRSSDVTTKNSPLWKTNPKQQLGYLQVKNWSRLYCPGAILGVYTPEELEDGPARGPIDVTPSAQSAPPPSTRAGQLKQHLGARPAAPALPAPSLDDVLQAINSAMCKADMDKAKAIAKQLTDPKDVDQAFDRYERRVQELKAQAEKSQAPAFDAAGFAKRLEACSDIDTLDLMADEVRSITDDAVRAHLENVYHERRAVLLEG
jgi:hypothetical protein